MYFKKFLFALQTIFSIHNLQAGNFFQPTTACEQFFYEKGNSPPLPIKKLWSVPNNQEHYCAIEVVSRETLMIVNNPSS